jgi:hypothetical protein
LGDLGGLLLPIRINDIWFNEKVRAEIVEQSAVWSQRVLDMSGLLEESIA